MHRTLKQETAMPPAANRRTQQRVMDRFCEEYNQVRPHEALGMQTPAAVYETSPREFPVRVPEVEYPDTMLVRKVQQKGHFHWKKHEVFVSEVLWGESVGLLPVDDHCFTVYFAQLPIARFDIRHAFLLPLNQAKDFYIAGAKEGDASPSSALHPLNPPDQKVSGICPV